MTDDMWAELDAIYKLPNRQLGDIDSSQFAERYGISETTARRRMKKMVRSGKYYFLTVQDTSSNNHGYRLIIRETPNATDNHSLEQ